MRIPEIRQREQLADTDRAVWDLIAESRGRVVGPFSRLLHSPELARRSAQLGSFTRFDSVAPATARETANLAVAALLDCEYEWAAHEPLARDAGIPSNVIETIRRKDSARLTGEAALIYGSVEQLIERHRISDETFAQLRERFSVRELVELVGVIAYAVYIAMPLNVFEVPASG